MKPLRTGLAAGLLAGGVAAANKLVSEWRDGTGGSPRVVTGTNGKAAVKGGVSTAVSGVVARRAARKAEANRPPWVVAPVPGVTAIASAPVPARAMPAVPRKLPSLSLDQLRPPTAKAVGVSVGKYAAKQAGKAIGKVAAERVGKAIEVVETLEKVLATASAPVTSPDMTPSGPGATAAVVAAPVESASAPKSEPRPKPQGTLVSVRTFERGPRVVVGPGVQSPPPPPPPAAEVVEAVEAVDEAIVEAPPAEPVAKPPRKKKAAAPKTEA
ncbi:MAG TPA: hypothetical protein VF244_04685 [Acidimicrobiales bacterium]